MFDRFSHYLTYGASDQETARELTGAYDGLIVPGTVAAFQREGTGGFVLSLSATPAEPPYLIDPRFPLFQQALEEPKKSHEALAALLGAPELVRESDPEPAEFTDQLIKNIAEKWVEFNTNYDTHQATKFQKYASRLNEEVQEDGAKGPNGIIAPYLVSMDEPSWQVSRKFMAATVAAAPEDVDVLRVVACSNPMDLGSRLADVSDERVIIWASGMEELEVLPGQLVDYGQAIRAASERGQSCFALYGGFFSVLLAAVGLKGACHGIGYGEHRNWPELSRSGPPPSRYYAPRFHRYISQDLAYQLWSRDPDLTACACAICNYGAPVLSYHDLMKHSVLARRDEIDQWGALDLGEVLPRLRGEQKNLQDDIEAVDLPKPLADPAARATRHFGNWVSALEQLAADETAAIP